MALRDATIVVNQSSWGAAMATAWVEGKFVKAKGRIDGKVVRRARAIPNADPALGEAMVVDLQRRVALGDYSWLTEGVRNRVYRRATRSQTPFDKYASGWLDAQKGQISEHAWRSYQSAIVDLKKRVGALPVSKINKATAITLRSQWVADGRAERTIGDRLRLFRQILGSAQDSGLIDTVPFEARTLSKRTKRARREISTRRMTFAPLLAKEIQKLLDMVRTPTNDMHRRYWPLTEVLLQFPIRGPLEDLLRRQRAVSFVGRDGGWVFPSESDTSIDYRNWQRRAWSKLLTIAKVEPPEKDAQKALRRSFVCSSLMCGRNPKLVASELGHATARMVTDQYDAFMDPANWPEAKELDALRLAYGWDLEGKPGTSAVFQA